MDRERVCRVRLCLLLTPDLTRYDCADGEYRSVQPWCSVKYTNSLCVLHNISKGPTA